MKSAIALRALLAPCCCVLLAVAASGDTLHPEWWDDAEQVMQVVPALSRLESSVAYDGSLEEWRRQPAVPLGLTHQTGFDPDWRGPTDLSAQFYFGYGSATLMFAVEVADNTLVTAPGGRNRGDRVELFLAGSPHDQPERALALLIAGPTDGQPAALLDADRLESIPGAVVTWVNREGGYQIEGRVPWAALPAGWGSDRRLLGCHLRVIDWDDTKEERAKLQWPSSIRPPEPPPTPPKVEGYDPPRVTRAPRPELLGGLRLLPRETIDDPTAYLPAFMPLGAESSFYDGGETARIVVLAGLDLPTALGMQVYLADEDGRIGLLTRDRDWTEGVVTGLSWVWRTPAEFTASRLIVGALGDAMRAENRVYGRIESVGDNYRQHLARLADVRERMMAAATAPGADARRRRYIGSILINLEDREQSHAAWSRWMDREDLDRLAREISELEGLFQTALAGDDPYRGKKGTYLRGYVSDLDDTLQHYSVSIPDKWSPTAKMPLIMSLHGYGFGRFLGHPAPSEADAVSVSCFGRGNGDYKLWCEDDLTTVVAAMIEDYGCDPARVYSRGGSMGGTGSWHIATLFPDRFAAIAPTAGNANHHVWEEVWGWGQREPTFLTPFRNWLESTTSAFQYAENLRHVGTYCVHGTLDNICPVGHARTMSARLEKLGYDIVYEEHPTVGHGGFPSGVSGRQKSYMMLRSRPEWPRQVTYKASWLRYPGAYWVTLERFTRFGTDALIDATVDGRTVIVATTNLDRFSLHLAEQLLPGDEPVRVLVDGRLAFEGRLPLDRRLRLGRGETGWTRVEAPRRLEKTPTVCGPLEHLYMQRFLVVIGTAGDRLTNEVNRLSAERFAEKWRRWGRGQRPRVKFDWEVTDADIADSNLICYGGPDSNRFVNRINARLPVRLEPGRVVFGEEEFAGDDVGIKLCYPNPLNPERYVAVFAGVTWRGTYDIDGRFGNWFDWGVFDDRNWFDFAVFDAHTQSPETFLRVGYFDSDWSLAQATIIRGDEGMRRAAQPRRPPEPLAPLPDRDEVYLSELSPRQITMEKGVLAYDSSFGGHRITLGASTFERGLGVHPHCELTYDIAGQFQTFEAWVGVDLEGASTVSQAREEAEKVAFQVYGDGRQLADTGQMRWNSEPRHLVLNVEGVKELRLVTRALDGRKWLFGNSSWGGCRLSRAPAPAATPAEPRAGADRLSLAGSWLLNEYAIGEGLAVGAERDTRWLPDDRVVTIPGSLPASMMATGQLPDLYLNDNLKLVVGQAAREWWLYRRFDVPRAWHGQRVLLSLAGVHQHAEVWVNERYVGKVAGPAAVADLDLTAAVRLGESNFVAIRLLAGPAAWTAEQQFRVPAQSAILGPGAAYGADGGGTAICLGLTRAPELRSVGTVRLEPVRAEVELAEGLVARGEIARLPGELTVTTELVNDGSAATDVELAGVVRRWPEGTVAAQFSRTIDLAAGERRPTSLRLPLPALDLWWPAGLGRQPLYQLDVRVARADRPSDQVSVIFGARDLRLDPEAKTPTVLANGYPVVLRSVDWRPSDRLLRPAPHRLARLLRAALAAGFNTIRVGTASGLAEPDLYRLCDELGLLVIQDLPLTGNLTGTPSDLIAANVSGLVTATRNQAGLLAYCLGDNLADNPVTTRAVATAAEQVARLAPTCLTVAPTRGGDGRQVWEWTDNRGAASFARQAQALAIWQLELPGAPPADLSWLRRDDLPEAELLMPWPLTGWWRFRGGSDRDQEQATAWLGESSAELLDQLLTAHQAAVARQGLAEALRQGLAVSVTCLNESWPRVGSALVDYSGQPRPAWDEVRRLLNPPAVVGLPRASRVAHGQRLVVPVVACLRPAGEWWDQPDWRWSSVRCRVLDPLGRVWAEQAFELVDRLGGARQVGELVWTPDESVPAGPYWVVTDAPGSGLQADLQPVAVSGPAQAPVGRLLWLAGGEPPAGWDVVGVDWLAAPSPGIDVIYLGPGFVGSVPEGHLRALYQAVAAGAGVIIDGPPSWLLASPLASLVPVSAVPLELTPSYHPVTPTVEAAGHPALAGLRGSLPAALPDGPWRLTDGATTLVGLGSDCPLLVEVAQQRSRVLLWRSPRDYHRRLALWTGWERFQAGLLAYAGKLSHQVTAALLTNGQSSSFTDLVGPEPRRVEVKLANSPVTVRPGRSVQLTVEVANPNPGPLPLVRVTCQGLPPGITADYSAAATSLLPGERRRLVLTLRADQQSSRSSDVRVIVDGWGVVVQETVIKVTLAP